MENTQHLSSGRGKRILSLDGGGVRGLSTLIFLDKIMQGITRELRKGEVVKPCDYFNLIGGTSAGGIICIMLGRLRMSVEECIIVFKEIIQDVFGSTGKKNMMRLKPYKFNAEHFTKAIKKVLRGRDLDEDEMLFDSSDNSCKTFVTAISIEDADPLSPTLLKSYDKDDEFPNIKIWEACRATSAAVRYFKPIEIGTQKRKYSDAAVAGFSNPAGAVIDEAVALWPNAHVDCFLTIGAGKHGKMKISDGGNIIQTFRSWVKYLAKAATGTAFAEYHAGERFRMLYPGPRGIYHRLNVAEGLEDIAICDYQKMGDIEVQTTACIEDPETLRIIDSCVRGLLGIQPPHSRVEITPPPLQAASAQRSTFNKLELRHPEPSGAPMDFSPFNTWYMSEVQSLNQRAKNLEAEGNREKDLASSFTRNGDHSQAEIHNSKSKDCLIEASALLKIALQKSYIQYEYTGSNEIYCEALSIMETLSAILMKLGARESGMEYLQQCNEGWCWVFPDTPSFEL